MLFVFLPPVTAAVPHYFVYDEPGSGYTQGSLDFGDVDGDGDQDLVVAGVDAGGDEHLLVFENSPGSGFTLDQQLAPGLRHAGVELVDLDDDGAPELVAVGQDASNDPRFVVFENDGTGGFTLTQQPAADDPNLPTPGFIHGDVQPGDLDQDGDLDLVVMGTDAAGDEYLVTFENDGLGNLSVLENVNGTTDEWPWSNQHPGTARGELDWQTYDPYGKPLLSTGRTRDFGSRALFHWPILETGLLYDYPEAKMGTCDFTKEAPDGVIGSAQFVNANGDTYIDFSVLGNSKCSGRPAFELHIAGASLDSTGPNTDYEQPHLAYPEFALHLSTHRWADLDGDGDLDAVLMGDPDDNERVEDPRLFVLRNDGDGNLTLWDEPLGDGKGLATSARGMALADFTGNGAVDIGVVGRDNGQDTTAEDGSPRLILLANNVFQSCVDDDIDEGLEHDCENESVISDTRVQDTEVRVDVPPDTRALFHQVIFETPPGAADASTSSAEFAASGAELKETSMTASPAPDYTTTLPLLDAGRDTLTVRVWTNQSRHAQFVNLRADSESLNDSGLPPGIPATPEGKEALARTAVMLEFADESGTIMGDFSTTTDIGDSFAYNLRYKLSEETMGLFGELGIDTSPGSGAFGFHYADTYGGTWTEDTGVEVEVRAGERSGRVVSVRGLTKDLPGSLAATSTTSDTPGGGGAGTSEECVIERTAPRAWTETLRNLRDAALLGNPLGRRMAGAYYRWFGPVEIAQGR